MGMMAPAPETRAIHGRALVVEDSPTDGHVLKSLLEQLGCDCDVVVDGERAVSAAVLGAYDFVFMDVLMPGMDGLETTRFIHDALGPRSPFVVAVTSLRTEADRRRCMEAGMDYFLAKPVTKAALTKIVVD